VWLSAYDTGSRPDQGVTLVRGTGNTSQRDETPTYRSTMDNRSDVREFLTSRRARITPQQAGLPSFGDNRRVPGLRRSEVAMLAGVSVEYYTRLERGNLSGVSEPVLESLAKALRLDDAERAHLFDLARAAGTSNRTRRRTAPARVRPSIQRVLDALTTPAYARNARMDILAANSLCFALYTDILTPEAMPLNLARFLFLEPRSQDFFVEWDTVTDDAVAALRTEAGRNPLDRNLSDLIGELATRSQEFRARWARHDVRLHRSATKRLRHPIIGEIELTGDALELSGDGLTVIAYTAPADSPAQQQLDFLANWSTPPAAPTERTRTADPFPDSSSSHHPDR
jgi:transcriptional regulator with XRE-family HTH domain